MDPLLGGWDGDPGPLVIEPDADPDEEDALPELPGDDLDGAA